ncbi:MAG: DUF7681 family protein [archaeon]
MEISEIQLRFTYHKPTEKKIEDYGTIRSSAENFANRLNQLCPESREKSLAITKLEEVVMWANASIARRE